MAPAFSHPQKDWASQTSQSHEETDGGFSPDSTPLKPCWDKISFKCQTRRSSQVALPPSLGIFLTPQGLLTHRQCPGGCISHLLSGGRQVGQAEPRPHGERDAFSSDSSLSCLWRERQQLRRVGVALLFSVYRLCSLSFPTWGTRGLKARVQHFVAGMLFFFSSSPDEG